MAINTGVNASKMDGYAVLGVNRGVNAAKVAGYAVLSIINAGLNVSKINGYAVLGEPDPNPEVSDMMNWWADTVNFDSPIERSFNDNLTQTDTISFIYANIFLALTRTVGDNFIVTGGPPSGRSRGLQDGFAYLASPDFVLEVNTDDISNFLKDDVTIAFNEFFNEAGPCLAYDSMQFNWQDEAVVLAVVPRNVSDALNFFDAIEKFAAISLNRGDSFELLDFVNPSRNVLPIAADTIEMQDGEVAVSIAGHEERTVADVFTMSDAINLLRSTSFLSYIRRYLNDVP